MLDSDGEVTIGVDGKSALTVKEWVNSQPIRDAKPHWFLAKGQGSGAFQTGHSGGSTNTIKRDAFLELSPQKQKELFRQGVFPVD